MILFQILASLFIVFVLMRVIFRYKEERVPKSEVWVWGVFWLLMAIAIWWPRGTDIVANYLGISRGYELVVAMSLAIIFYLIFKVFVHIHRLQYQVTDLVRNLAIKDHELENLRKNNE